MQIVRRGQNKNAVPAERSALCFAHRAWLGAWAAEIDNNKANSDWRRTRRTSERSLRLSTFGGASVSVAQRRALPSQEIDFFLGFC
jgi:hypothetical protein